MRPWPLAPWAPWARCWNIMGIHGIEMDRMGKNMGGYKMIEELTNKMK